MIKITELAIIYHRGVYCEATGLTKGVVSNRKKSYR
jgi:hypothetical protein